MAEHLNGNRLFFGRYIGDTPVTGHPGSPDTPRGLDAFLTKGKKAAKDRGSIWFPDHKKADPLTGELALEEAWEDEYGRRKRRLDDLFDELVACETAQLQARLHALDLQGRDALDAELDAHIREHGAKSIDRSVFVAHAKRCGKRTRSSLERQYGVRLGERIFCEELNSLLLTAEDGQLAPSSTAVDDSAFVFPSVDGCEQSNRWDMQSHPPDILITNVSMLSAMLSRELEDPILQKTQDWLSKPDSYFYLVLDELHLQRGAAGTEVSYLLRLLLHRLGLTRPEHRHKLRVLASSASLPTEPMKDNDSTAYLWQMFGSFGLDASEVERTPPEGGRRLWQEAIIAGREMPSRYAPAGPTAKLSARPFEALLQAHRHDDVLDPDQPLAQPLFVRVPSAGSTHEAAWRNVCETLGTNDPSLATAISRAIVEVSDRLIWACWERGADSTSAGGRTRAQPIDDLAELLFSDLPVGSGSYAARATAVRGLLFVRGAGDALGAFLPERTGTP
ncbi:MAG TPA: hypothetical protein VGC79_14650, partial [Polyangiaceae bacterium]